MEAIVQTVLQKMGTLFQPQLTVTTTLSMTIVVLCDIWENIKDYQRWIQF